MQDALHHVVTMADMPCRDNAFMVMVMDHVKTSLHDRKKKDIRMRYRAGQQGSGGGSFTNGSRDAVACAIGQHRHANGTGAAVARALGHENVFRGKKRPKRLTWPLRTLRVCKADQDGPLVCGQHPVID